MSRCRILWLGLLYTAGDGRLVGGHQLYWYKPMRIHLSCFRVYIHSLVTITSYDIYPLLAEYPWIYNVAILYNSCTTVWLVYSNILSSINLLSIQLPFNQQPGVKSVARLFKMSLEHNQRIYWPRFYDLHQPKSSTQGWVIFIFFLHNWWKT